MSPTIPEIGCPDDRPRSRGTAASRAEPARPWITALHPSATRLSASARPKPFEPPVINAVCMVILSTSRHRNVLDHIKASNDFRYSSRGKFLRDIGEGTNREGAHAFDLRRYSGEGKAGRRQLGEVGQVFDDRNVVAQQGRVDRSAEAVGTVGRVDVERVDPGAGDACLDERF